MLKRISLLGMFLLLNMQANASPNLTARTALVDNEKIAMWQTVIYPSANQVLKMHRHAHDRIVVAFDNGLLKITNDKGKIHYWKLNKNQAYFLRKDVPHELHQDENMTNHAIKVLVIELKNNS